MAPRWRVGAIVLFVLSCAAAATPQAQGTPNPLCSSTSALSPGLRAACTLLAAMPDRYAPQPGRARPGPERLRESVVRLQGTRIDLEPLLSELRPVRYRVRFQPIGPPRSAPNQPFEVMIDGNALMWTAEWPASTGLFRATIYPAVPMGSPRIDEEAWLLVQEGRFDQTSAAFAELSRAVPADADGAPGDDARVLLRALLESLATPQ
jgi:hypothetical protein